MADNQLSGSQGNQGKDQKPQTLSWSQPQAKPQTVVKSSAMPRTMGATSSRRIALFFVLGLIIGWLVTWSWFDLRSKNSNEYSTATSTPSSQTENNNSLSITQTQKTGVMNSSSSVGSDSTKSTTGEMSAASITVPSPQVAGTNVVVSNITSNVTLWAVVYEDANGTAGRALGAKFFNVGETSGTIPLLRSTLPNLSYFVGLVSDTPEHTFDVHLNQPLLGSDGKQILTKFTAQ